MLGVVGCGQFVDLLGDLGQENSYVRVANIETGGYLDIPVDETILKGLIELSAGSESKPGPEQEVEQDANEQLLSQAAQDQPSVAEMFEDNVTPFAIGDEE